VSWLRASRGGNRVCGKVLLRPARAAPQHPP
jgi:hypothetical protein